MNRRTLLLSAFAAAALSPALAQAQAGPTTLGQALRQALVSNPRLTAADRDIGMADGRRQQAGAYPNPRLGAEVDNVTNASRRPETTLQLSQLIELGGKRDARVAAALGDYDSARWQREAVRLAVLSETASAFVALLGAQRRLQLHEREVAALDRLAPVMQRRLEAGAASAADVARVQVAIDLARADRERGRADIAGERWALAAAMGVEGAAVAAVAGALDQVAQPPAWNAVLGGIEANPQLMRWTAIGAQRAGQVLAARAKAVPDLEATVGWRYWADTNDHGVRLGVSVPIPLLDQNRGGIREAQESAAKVESERKTDRLALLATVGRAYETVQGALRELDLLRRSALPNARTAFDGLERGYGEGRYSLLELLDGYRMLFGAQRREIDALVSFHAAIATIEGLTGTAFTLAGR